MAPSTGSSDPFAEDEEGEQTPPPRRRGRPPKAGKRVTKVTRQEYTEPDEDEDEPAGGSLLFADAGKLGLARVRITRVEPNEGMVGYLEDGENAGEKEIFERWGGGTYRCQGLDSDGKIAKVATIRIAGDPIFMTTMARLNWEQTRRRLSTPEAPSAAPVQPQMSTQDMLTFFREQETLRMTAEREHQERMRKLDEVAEERRRRDDEDRDRRRKQDEEERDRRRRQEQEQSEQRQQTFLQQTIAMMSAANNQTLEFVKATAGAKSGGNDLLETVKTIAVIKDAFGGGGGGDSDADADPVTMLIKEGPKWLDGLGGAIGGAIREYKGNPAPVAGGAAPLQLPASNPVAGLPLPPTLAPKVAALVAKIVEKGGNPEEVLNQVVDNVLLQVDKLEKIPPKPPVRISPQAAVNPQQGPAPAPVVQTPSAPPGGNDILSRVIRMPFARPKAGKVLPS